MRLLIIAAIPVAIGCDGAPTNTGPEPVCTTLAPIRAAAKSELRVATVSTVDGSTFVARRISRSADFESLWLGGLTSELLPTEWVGSLLRPHQAIWLSVGQGGETTIIGNEITLYQPPEHQGLVVELHRGWLRRFDSNGVEDWNSDATLPAPEEASFVRYLALAVDANQRVATIGDSGVFNEAGDRVAYQRSIWIFSVDGTSTAQVTLPSDVRFRFADVCCTDDRAALTFHPDGDLVAVASTPNAIWVGKFSIDGEARWARTIDRVASAGRAVGTSVAIRRDRSMAVGGSLARDSANGGDAVVYVLASDGEILSSYGGNGAANQTDVVLALAPADDGSVFATGALRQRPHASGDPSLQGPGTLWVGRLQAGVEQERALVPSQLPTRWSYGLDVSTLGNAVNVAGYTWTEDGEPGDQVQLCAFSSWR